jgi:hypothetical protein
VEVKPKKLLHADSVSCRSFCKKDASKRGRRDFKLTSCEKVAYLVSPATKKARELLCRDVQGYTCQSYPTILFKEAIIEKPAS